MAKSRERAKSPTKKNPELVASGKKQTVKQIVAKGPSKAVQKVLAKGPSSKTPKNFAKAVSGKDSMKRGAAKLKAMAQKPAPKRPTPAKGGPKR